MDQITVSKVAHERMGHWLEELVELNCTPVLLVAVGHGDKAPGVHIFTPAELPAKAIEKVIAMAGLDLKRKDLWRKAAPYFGEEVEAEGQSAEPAGLGAKR